MAELSELLAQTKQEPGLPLRIIGGATNVILPAHWECRCVRIGIKGIEVRAAAGQNYIVRAAAGENWHELVRYCLDRGLHGLENLALIPGDVGAAPIQNIGAYGAELKDFLHSVEAVAISDGAARSIPAAACGLKYRQSKFKHEWRDKFIITHINLRLASEPRVLSDYERLKSWGKPIKTPRDLFEAVVAIRRAVLPDPAAQGNAGSFFHNPVVCGAHLRAVQRDYPQVKAYELGEDKYRLAAASLLEALGFKGYRQGGVAMSEQHPLCMINLGAARYEEVLALAAEVQAKVERLTEIKLTIEPRVY